ncbi:TetR/AcrR family transcriptional regulator [Novosphingobium profundi]|uniref:TetR/AcrR family transcriptional regulator n=1 Tax=Novosphingobium profundi TaxID=1774954 RepID=UPI001BD9557A|nr:TetR/AcrR family transcriptional regulator [Novosphingobium profundi]MBT0669168.1 TetR/AcrR family transcriptional regulator [Novosphingobium profundi]
MPALTREESQARTRRLLLEKGPEVVAREGYEAASIDKIAKAAGFSKGAFYSNFSSKEEFFLELLERHAGQDVEEITALLEGVAEPREIIDRMANWSKGRATDPIWGLLAIEIFRRARRDATYGERHAGLFRRQWSDVGNLLMPIASNWSDPQPELLGAMVLELTYGAASGFDSPQGPQVGDLVRLALEAFHSAHGAD